LKHVSVILPCGSHSSLRSQPLRSLTAEQLNGIWETRRTDQGWPSTDWRGEVLSRNAPTFHGSGAALVVDLRLVPVERHGGVTGMCSTVATVGPAFARAGVGVRAYPAAGKTRYGCPEPPCVGLWPCFGFSPERDGIGAEGHACGRDTEMDRAVPAVGNNPHTLERA